ncbi:unnamed protein product [Paramecium sonneborni]|uniref:Uncharacterized protein n=1 Tax=Paramecium sonneborni TaxID=65129 RepID=A0A8S1Q391_9CILI|nr:unnamed protein product [Paramecium sonneborni]
MNQKKEYLKNVFDQHILKEQRNNKYEPSSSLMQPTFQNLMHSLPSNIQLSQLKYQKYRSASSSLEQSKQLPSPSFGGQMTRSQQFKSNNILGDIKNRKY